MDKLNQAEYDKQMKNPQFARKFLAMQRKNDVVEERPDGFWTGPKAGGFDRVAFRVVSEPGVKLSGKFIGSSSTRKFRYSISEGEGEDIKVISGLVNLVVDKGA